MTSAPAQPVGRYVLFDEIASGGMATVHLARLVGPVGFSRTVAIKRLHRHYLKEPDFVAMFIDEARLAARIHHPNVVPVLDVVRAEDELFLVMDYVHGESLTRLMRLAREEDELIPLRFSVAIMVGVLQGLHAAHEARSEAGEPLHIVHRDVSPQNVLVGADGIPRVLDFGIAKARGRLQTTREGHVKGKLAYMSPEQIGGGAAGREIDIYAAGVLLWEALTGEPLFAADTETRLLAQVLDGPRCAPSAVRSGLPTGIDAIVMKALAREPGDRYRTAREMADDLEACVPVVSPSQLGEWVQAVARKSLGARAERMRAVESHPGMFEPPASSQPSLVHADSCASRPASTPSRRQDLYDGTAAGTGSHGLGFARAPEPELGPDEREGAGSGPDEAHGVDSSSRGAARSATSDGVVAAAQPATMRSGALAAPSRFKVGLLLGAALAVGILVAIALSWRSAPDPQAGATDASSSVPSVSTAASSGQAVVATSVPAAASGPPGTTPSLATAGAPASAGPTAGSASVVPAGRGSARPTSSSKARPAAVCDPAYWVDARGIQHLKPECL